VTRYPGGSFGLRTSGPPTARWYVRITNGEADALLGPYLTFPDRRCHRRGNRIVCTAGPFEAIPPTAKPWTVWAVKHSPARATITVRLTFTR
jgi:hypothetical protein